jgi:3-deoxy-manno-octulosonate cytidylyltransferase (CMP-KDO synthetase)
MNTDTLIVIPARFGSSRFPGKPLAVIKGIPLLERVWRIAKRVQCSPKVIIATDDERIQKAAELFGAEVVMTSPQCPNGSMRVCEVLAKLTGDFKVVVNLQGDAPLIPHWVIESILTTMTEDVAVEIATPAVQLSRVQYDRLLESKSRGIVSGTTVTFAKNGDALYFSKAVLPFFKKGVSQDPVPVFQHIGLYGYRPETLKKYVTLPEGQFEAIEDLEQLRALEHGMRIRVVKVSLRGRTLWPVDTPQDISRVEEIITIEGELVE